MGKHLSIVLLIALGLSVLFWGCSKEEEEPPTPPSITAPNVNTIPYTDSIRVVWKNSPEADEEGFLGYQLYISTDDLSLMSESELEACAVWDSIVLDTTYLLSSYEDSSLAINGIYYFGVRALRSTDNGDTTSPLRVVQTSPVIMGEGKIFEYSSDSVCAFNFAEGTAITSDETSPFPDIYLDTCGVCEVTGYAVKSPHLSASPWTGHTTFKLLGSGDPDEYPQTDESDMKDYCEVSMQVYAVKTSTNFYVKMWITSFGGEDPDKYIEFKYKYQTIPDYPHF